MLNKTLEICYGMHLNKQTCSRVISLNIKWPRLNYTNSWLTFLLHLICRFSYHHYLGGVQTVFTECNFPYKKYSVPCSCIIFLLMCDLFRFKGISHLNQEGMLTFFQQFYWSKARQPCAIKSNSVA